jgi:hypothetical protein
LTSKLTPTRPPTPPPASTALKRRSAPADDCSRRRATDERPSTNRHAGPAREQERTVKVSTPEVRYRSTNRSTYDACMDWQATLHLDTDDPTGTPICGGHTDFLTIRLGEAPLHGILSMADDTPAFAPLFDGTTLGQTIAEQFRHPINTVVIFRDIHIDPALRGHDLGAWMLSEVIARMATSTDTLVVGRQYPIRLAEDIVSRRRVERSLRPYWRKIGVVPFDGAPEFWVQTTSNDSLQHARTALAGVHGLALQITPGDNDGPKDNASSPKSGVQLISEMLE